MLKSASCCGSSFPVVAAVVFPPPDGRTSASRWLAYPMLLFGTGLAGFTVAALYRYFVESWRRVRVVSNRATYIVWLSLESSAAIVLVGLLVYGIVTR